MAEKLPGVSPAMPLYDEASPGLGRNSRVVDTMREQDGGFSDDPADNPVRDVESFRITSK